MHAADCVHRLILFSQYNFCQLVEDIDKNDKMSKEGCN